MNRVGILLAVFATSQAILPQAGLRAWFSNEDIPIDGDGTWSSRVGSFTAAATGGSVKGTFSEGHGATRPVKAFQGTESSSYSFGEIMPPVFTICSLSRYTGQTGRGRILTGDVYNVLFGHHNGAAGCVYINGWKSPGSCYSPNTVNVNDWMALCTTMQSNGILNSKKVFGAADTAAFPKNFKLVINAGVWGGEKSNWEVAEVVVWNRNLNDNELSAASLHLQNIIAPPDNSCSNQAPSGMTWKLAARIDGSLNNWYYDSPRWTDSQTFATSTELKTDAFFEKFDSIKLRMSFYSGPDKEVLLRKSGDSLQSIFQKDEVIETYAPKQCWRDLQPDGDFQPNCNKQGINMKITSTWTGTPTDDRIRIGILWNQEDNCNSNDAAIGVGIHIQKWNHYYSAANLILCCSFFGNRATAKADRAEIWIGTMQEGAVGYLPYSQAQAQQGCPSSNLVSRIGDDGVFPNAKLAASSVYNNDPIGISHGRGLFNSPQAWSAKTNTPGEWWQFDLTTAQWVTGIVTQPRADSVQFVRQYTVLTSPTVDTSQMVPVENGRMFNANFNAIDSVTHRFAPVSARLVRIVVNAFQGHLSMRAAVLTSACSTAGDVNFMLQRHASKGCVSSGTFMAATKSGLGSCPSYFESDYSERVSISVEVQSQGTNEYAGLSFFAPFNSANNYTVKADIEANSTHYNFGKMSVQKSISLSSLPSIKERQTWELDFAPQTQAEQPFVWKNFRPSTNHLKITNFTFPEKFTMEFYARGLAAEPNTQYCLSFNGGGDNTILIWGLPTTWVKVLVIWDGSKCFVRQSQASRVVSLACATTRLRSPGQIVIGNDQDGAWPNSIIQDANQASAMEIQYFTVHDVAFSEAQIQRDLASSTSCVNVKAGNLFAGYFFNSTDTSVPDRAGKNLDLLVVQGALEPAQTQCISGVQLLSWKINGRQIVEPSDAYAFSTTPAKSRLHVVSRQNTVVARNIFVGGGEPVKTEQCTMFTAWRKRSVGVPILVVSANEAACQASCIANPGCVQAVFRTSTRSCSLMQTVTMEDQDNKGGDNTDYNSYECATVDFCKLKGSFYLDFSDGTPKRYVLDVQGKLTSSPNQAKYQMTATKDSRCAGSPCVYVEVLDGTYELVSVLGQGVQFSRYRLSNNELLASATSVSDSPGCHPDELAVITSRFWDGTVISSPADASFSFKGSSDRIVAGSPGFCENLVVTRFNQGFNHVNRCGAANNVAYLLRSVVLVSKSAFYTFYWGVSAKFGVMFLDQQDYQSFRSSGLGYKGDKDTNTMISLTAYLEAGTPYPMEAYAFAEYGGHVLQHLLVKVQGSSTMDASAIVTFPTGHEVRFQSPFPILKSLTPNTGHTDGKYQVRVVGNFLTSPPFSEARRHGVHATFWTYPSSQNPLPFLHQRNTFRPDQVQNQCRTIMPAVEGNWQVEDAIIQCDDGQVRIFNDYFYVAFRGYLFFPQNGTYSFRAGSAGGVVLEVNNVLQVDNWYSGNFQARTGSAFQATSGFYPFRVSYRQWTGNAVVKLYWKKPGEQDFTEIQPQDYYLNAFTLEKPSKCSRPAGWCQLPSTFRMQDCDGDGIPDPTCSYGSQFGVIQSSLGCSDTWPSGTCSFNGKLTVGLKTGKILSYSETNLQANFPEGQCIAQYNPGNSPVKVFNQAEGSSGSTPFLFKAPVVTNINPSALQTARDSVTLIGQNFGQTPMLAVPGSSTTLTSIETFGDGNGKLVFAVGPAIGGVVQAQLKVGCEQVTLQLAWTDPVLTSFVGDQAKTEDAGPTGVMVNFTGSNIGTNSVVLLDGKQMTCEPPNADQTEIGCRLPTDSWGSQLRISILRGGVSFPTQLTYSFARPVITSTTCGGSVCYCPVQGCQITLVGTSFGPYKAGTLVHAYQGTVTEWTHNRIVVDAVRSCEYNGFHIYVRLGQQQSVATNNARVYIPAPTVLNYTSFGIDSSGSQLLTIGGLNFPLTGCLSLARVVVTDLRDHECEPQTVSDTLITCKFTSAHVGQKYVNASIQVFRNRRPSAVKTFQSSPWSAPRVDTVTTASYRGAMQLPTAGGASITLAGDNFGRNGLGVVKVEGKVCGTITWDATKIECSAPSGVKTASVWVELEGEILSNNKTIQYASPQILSLSPGNGTTVGGTRVVIQGSDFGSQAGVVKLDGRGCTVERWEDAFIQFVTPVGTGQNLTVLLESTAGSATGRFDYDPPTVVALTTSKTYGPTQGGKRLTVEGTNFGAVSNTWLIISGEKVPAQVVNNNRSFAEFWAPVGAGTQQMTVEVDGQTSKEAVLYPYDAPVISSITSSQCAPNGNGVKDCPLSQHEITISGTNFAPSAKNAAQPGQISVSLLVLDVASQPVLCDFASTTTSQIVCRPQENKKGGINVQVKVTVFGLSSVSQGLFSWQSADLRFSTPASVTAVKPGDFVDFDSTTACLASNPQKVDIRFGLETDVFSEKEPFIGSPADTATCTPIASELTCNNNSVCVWNKNKCLSRCKVTCPSTIKCYIPPSLGQNLVAEGIIGEQISANTQNKMAFERVAFVVASLRDAALSYQAGPGPVMYKPPKLNHKIAFDITNWWTPTDTFSTGVARNMLVTYQNTNGVNKTTYECLNPVVKSNSGNNYTVECTTSPSDASVDNFYLQVTSYADIPGRAQTSPFSLDYLNLPSPPRIDRVTSAVCKDDLNNGITDCPTVGGYPITIFGDAFTQYRPTVSVGGLQCDVSLYFEKNITCSLPAGAGEKVSVVVSTDDMFSIPKELVTYALAKVTKVSVGWEVRSGGLWKCGVALPTAGLPNDDIATCATACENNPSCNMFEFTVVANATAPTTSCKIFKCDQNEFDTNSRAPTGIYQHSKRDALANDCTQTSAGEVIDCPREGKATINLMGTDFGPGLPSVLVCELSCDNVKEVVAHRHYTCEIPYGTSLENEVGLLQSGGRLAAKPWLNIAYKQCTPGTFGSTGSNTTCYNCAVGKFTSLAGMLECDDCSLGRFASSNGLTSCLLCPPKTFGGTRGLSGCTDCAVGKYGPISGLASCEPCDAGTFNDKPAQLNCVPCVDGYHQPNTGASLCTACDKGSFSAQDRTKCTPCENGRFSNRSAVTQCEECKPGTVSQRVITNGISTGATVCSKCGNGFQQPLPGQLSCDLCEPGTYSDSPGAQFCQQCARGKFSEIQGQSFCSNCSAGTFSGQDGASSCQDCSLGTYEDRVGQGQCRSCPLGKYVDQTGQTVCSNCRAGFYNDEVGKDQCKKCPVGHKGQNTDRTLFAVLSAYPATTPQTFTDGIIMLNISQQGLDFRYFLERKNNSKLFIHVHTGESCSDAGGHLWKPLTGPDPWSKYTFAQQGQPDPLISDSGLEFNDLVDRAVVVHDENNNRWACGLLQRPSAFIQKDSAYFGLVAPAAALPTRLVYYFDKEPSPGYNLTAGLELGLYTGVSCSSYTSAEQQFPIFFNKTGMAFNIAALGYIQSNLLKFSDVVEKPFLTKAQLNNGSSSVLSCGVFSVRKPGLAKCQECPKGEYQPESGSTSCVRCKKGEFSALTKNEKCQRCPVGRYLDIVGMESCKLCPVGKVSSGLGLTSCQVCEPGKFQSSQGQSRCNICDAGWFSNATGQQSCQQCPRGTFSGVRGMSKCLDCATGRFANNLGTTDCQQCEKGYFTNQTMSLGCIACSVGAFQNKKGAAQCIPCSKGRFSGYRAMVECDACPLGRVQPAVASSTCIDCKVGTFQPLQAQTVCDICAPGKHQSSSKASTCYSCQPGTFANLPGQEFCTDCEGGKNQEQASATACSVCSVGRYAPPGSAKCTMCPPRQIAKQNGTESCVACPDKSDANKDRTECLCEVGYAQVMLPEPAPTARRATTTPTSSPTTSPSTILSSSPTMTGTSLSPTYPTSKPTALPTGVPTAAPSAPTTASPTSPSAPSSAPTSSPTTSPTPVRSDGFTNFKCDKCPPGAVCKEVGLMYSDLCTKPGWFQKNLKFERCLLSVDCPGGCPLDRAASVKFANDSAVFSVSPCAKYRTGDLCTMCQNDDIVRTSKTIGGECEVCASKEANWIWLVFVAIVALICAIVLYYIMLRNGNRLIKAAAQEVRMLEEMAENDMAVGNEIQAQVHDYYRHGNTVTIHGPPSPIPNFMFKMKIAVGFVQIMSNLMIGLDIAWPNDFKNFLQLFNIINLDFFAGASVACVLKTNYFYKVWFMIGGVPTSLLVLWIFFLLPQYGRHLGADGREKRKAARQRFWSLVMFTLFLVYPTVSSTILRLYQCKEVYGVTYLRSDFSILCSKTDVAAKNAAESLATQTATAASTAAAAAFQALAANQSAFAGVNATAKTAANITAVAAVRASTAANATAAAAKLAAAGDFGTQWFTHVMLVLPALVLIPLGIPLFMLHMLRRYRGRFDELSVRAELGFLYDAYERSLWWWEMLDMGHKLSLVALVAFVPQKQWQVMVAVTIAFLYMAAILVLKPYLRKADDRVHQFAQMEIIFGLLTAYWLGGLDEPMAEDEERLLTAVLIIACFVFFFFFSVGISYSFFKVFNQHKWGKRFHEYCSGTCLCHTLYKRRAKHALQLSKKKQPGEEFFEGIRNATYQAKKNPLSTYVEKLGRESIVEQRETAAVINPDRPPLA